MSSDAAKKAPDLLDMPAHILERIVSRLDTVQDIVVLSSCSRTAHAAVAELKWRGVHELRLLHGAPSPAEAARIVCRCPTLKELDATGSAQALPEILQAFAHVPLQVLRLSGCKGLASCEGALAITPMLALGELRVLELSGSQTPSDRPVMKGVLKQRELRSLSMTCWRWDEERVKKLAEIGTACPNLKHLKIEESFMRLRGIPSQRRLKLESLSLAGSKWIGTMGYAGSQLTHLDVSGTEISDDELKQITELNLCPLLERLNISRCKYLTDGSINSLGMSDAVTQGRLWDLDMAALGLGFTGRCLGRMLTEWAWAHQLKQELGLASSCSREENAPGLSLNVSCNFVIEPVHFEGFLLFGKASCAQISHFRAQSCPRLAAPLTLGGASCFNVLGKLAELGSFHLLETLDLRDVFCASQQSRKADEATLASAIRGTGGGLKRLLIDNGCAGADVAEAIAFGGGCLEELSMPCCTGLSDEGLQAIAAACKQLKRLSVGGPSRAWSETEGLAAFNNLEGLDICRRSLLTSGQLGHVLGQHPALEALKLCSCPRVSDEALELLPADSLKELTLVCCDGIEGRPLSQLRRLETLEFSSCNAVTEESIQVIAVSCTRLKELGLPKHIPMSCIPTQARGHLRGLQISGGSKGARASQPRYHVNPT